MKTSETTTAIFEALAKAQGEIENPTKTKTGKVSGVSKKTNKYFEYEYTYAALDDIFNVIRKVFPEHGLSIIQPTTIEDNSIVLITRLAHSSGEWIESRYPVCGLNGDHQKTGAALTYARRYALTALVGISAVDDTDGEGAAPIGDGERKPLSMAEAREQLNWEVIQKQIDTAPNLQKVEKLRERIDANKGYWPKSYVSQAFERLRDREEELKALAARDFTMDEFKERLVECVTESDLNQLFNEYGVKTGEWSEDERGEAMELFDQREAEIKSGAGLLSAG